jgi:hypothetical protein
VRIRVHIGRHWRRTRGGDEVAVGGQGSLLSEANRTASRIIGSKQDTESHYKEQAGHGVAL